MNNSSSTQRRYSRNTALLLSILIDLIGVLTYLLPVVGESLDVAWAPISVFLLQHVYGNWAISLLGGLEEVSPGFDFIPTALLAWMLTYGWKVAERRTPE